MLREIVGRDEHLLRFWNSSADGDESGALLDCRFVPVLFTFIIGNVYFILFLDIYISILVRKANISISISSFLCLSLLWGHHRFLIRTGSYINVQAKA